MQLPLLSCCFFIIYDIKRACCVHVTKAKSTFSKPFDLSKLEIAISTLNLTLTFNLECCVKAIVLEVCDVYNAIHPSITQGWHIAAPIHSCIEYNVSMVYHGSSVVAARVQGAAVKKVGNAMYPLPSMDHPW